MRFGFVPPAHLPGAEQQHWDRGDIGTAQPALPWAEREGDGAADQEQDAEIGEPGRQGQEEAGRDVAAPVAAFHRQQRRQAEEDGANEADLERPQQHFPGGAKEGNQGDGEESEPISDPPPHIDEQEGALPSRPITESTYSGRALVIPKTRNMSCSINTGKTAMCSLWGKSTVSTVGSLRSIRNAQVP